MTIPDKEPYETEDSILSLDGHDIHVCQDGPRDAPVLLLIHGSASSTLTWAPMVPLLTKAHHVIRIDLLGHGRSGKPDGGGYEFPAQGRRAGMALDRLGVEKAIVAGHSSGGMVATALAEQRPDLVTALVLINTGPSRDAFIAPASDAIGPSQWPPTDEQIRRFASSGFSREGYRIPQELVDDMRQMTYHSLTAGALAGRDYLARQALPDRLAALGTPLQVIFGELDRRWEPSCADRYRAVPGAKVAMLPGVGHSPPLEDPPRTAELLLAFTALHTAPNVSER